MGDDGRMVIRGGRVLDPAHGIDAVLDLLIADGRVAALAAALPADGGREVDARGLLVAPGLIDLHTHLREPGQEYKETIASGTRAAAAGGFTTVCAMPNTDPPVDNRSVVEYIQRTAASEGRARVLVVGAITRGRGGRQLAEMAELADAGCVGFSDDGSYVVDSSLMRHALEYALALGMPVLDHAEDPVLAAGGVMHEGWVATRLGLKGVPAAAEEAAVARDIQLAELTGSHIHIQHVSTAGAVALVRAAKARGVPVTAEVTPHHLTLTHEAVLGQDSNPYDTNCRVNPPLRTPSDVEACIDGLLDGTIDAVATDHAPHATTDKLCEFDLAAPGLTGLETALALVLRLVDSGRLPLAVAIERLTSGPARALRLAERTRLPGFGTLALGAPADVVLVDVERPWMVRAAESQSRGRNTPFAGWTLKGQVMMTIAAGRTTFDRLAD